MLTNFKTSNVTVNQLVLVAEYKREVNFKTSNVTVNQVGF